MVGLVVVFALALVDVFAGGLRQVVNFNRDWLFKRGDIADAAATDYDCASWERVGLPHSFSIPYFAAGSEFYVGYGWYRKAFEIPAEWTGRRLFLDFEGAFQEAEIFVNGRPVGRHLGGYTGFEIEITDVAKTGSNVVAVRLNNLWNPRLAPRAGEHAFSGGLYRNVWLVAKDPLHVAWYGTCVTTQAVSEASGIVKVVTEVVNGSQTSKTCTVHTDILDPNGKTVARLRSTQTVVPGETVEFVQVSDPVPDPLIWSPEQPHLYEVKTTVWDGDRPVDDCVSPLGFRWFEFTADRGFFLNGKHRYFKGANVHQDRAGWGDATTNAGFHRDVRMMKDAGFDFIRGAHYPHAPAFSAACDKIGMLFWSENCFWGTAGFKSPWASSAYPTNPDDEPAFEASVKNSMRDMIRIHRNHPSVIVWSTGNEVFFSDPNVMPKVRRFLSELAAYARELDPTRPVAIGGSQRGDTDRLGDIAGYNGDGARLFPNPGLANVVSEYGSTIADRPGRYEAGWGDLPTTPGADPAELYPWRLPWRSGEAIWCGFDHGSVAGRKFGAMGIVDYFRLPKRQWYWYRNAYLGIPPPEWPGTGIPAALKLTADKVEIGAVDGTDDAQLIITVLDHEGNSVNACPPVTLTIESGPGEFPTGREITFVVDSDIPIRDGSAAIDFRSYHAGETVIRATSPGLHGAVIRLTSAGGPAYVPDVTPVVKPRPYARFSIQAHQAVEELFGRNTPTRTSSEDAGHAGSAANDGNPLTSWRASLDDSKRWILVDLERIVDVRRIGVTFSSASRWRYRVEISPDGERDWTVLLNSADDDSGINIKPVIAGAPAGRFVRITLQDGQAEIAPAVAEVVVWGIPAGH
ncbi:MAG: glycoside hydrolase family 2 TIM barrel-domain containing protein [Nibricoccus sp.]